MYIFHRLIVAFLSLNPVLSTTVWTSYNSTLDTSTCVAPKAYEACYANYVTGTAGCYAIARTPLEREACACAGAVLQIQCFAEACWNKVYSCEYQTLIFGYFQCGIAAAPVPYWPAPDNAPGGCSCNTGLILYNALVATNNVLSCINNATNTLLRSNPLQASVLDTACECCMESVVISSFYDICPTTNPNILGLSNFESLMALSFPWPQCGDSLSKYDCVKDLSFIAPTQSSTTGTLYNPTNLPASGSLTLSNTAGQVTAPPSGSSFLWSAIGTQFTILASPSEKGGAAIVAGTTTAGSAAASTTSGSSGSSSKSGVPTNFHVDLSAITVWLLASCFFGFL